MILSRSPLRTLGALAPLLFFAACAAQPATPPVTDAPAPTRGWIAPAAKKCAQRVFVAAYHLNYVAVYCTKGRNQAPMGKITDGINGPEGLAVDGKANLYVTNTSGNTVTEYAAGSTKPSFTYSADLSSPGSVAVDKKQNVYVTNLSPASVTIFGQHSNTPKLQITSNLTFPIDVAVDARGDVYVTTYNADRTAGEIIEYGPGSSQGSSLGIATKVPGGIAIDKAGDIVTADPGIPAVLVFPKGKTVASKIFAQNEIYPDPVRLTQDEKLVYVGDTVGNSVYAYDYRSGKLVDTITDGVDGPNGVALDPAAPLYSPKE